MADQTITIPSGWKSSTLEEVVLKANTGADAIKRAPIVNRDTGIKCLRIQDVSQKKDYKNWGFTSVSDSDFKKFQLKNGELFIARTGASIGANLIINKDLNAVFNNGLIRLRVNEKSIPSYVSYLLFSQHFKNYILSISQGTSTQPNIQIGALLRFPIVIPPISEQNAIVSILSSLDKKIELLKEQNSALETTAQAFFKEWFVNFNFPGATGKMIHSELGQIPEGWRVEKITDIFDFIKGSEPGAANYSSEKFNNHYVPFYRVQDISSYGDIPKIYVEEKLLRGKIFSPDDILISLDGTIGRVFIGGAGGHSGGIRRVVGKQDFIKKSLIFCFLKSSKFQNDLVSFSGAETTIKHAGGAIEQIKFALHKDVCESFGKALDPLLKKMTANISQIQTISTLRDTLLPKLMKGEVRAKGFEE